MEESIFDYETRDVDIQRKGKKITFTLKEITADDFWSLRDSCIDKTKDEMPLDTNQLNLKCIAKSLKSPSMTLEQVANLPKPIADRLLIEFNILNGLDKTFFLEAQPEQESSTTPKQS